MSEREHEDVPGGGATADEETPESDSSAEQAKEKEREMEESGEEPAG